ncbi:MAG TPA: GNAT family N-acetyltransferase [Chthoniobacteraceae bacterium]|jgi:GNAT superfamily N-acetyltransferase|nr:GNAT family N-acetyltransferase [Chthoniobacteraceae bacterium]
MDGNLLIRAFRPDDAVSSITALLHLAYASLLRMGFRYTASHQDDDTTLRRLRRGYPFVAERDGEIVATITLYSSSSQTHCEWYLRPEIYSFGQFGVSPDLQRCGIGLRLILFVEQQARERGARELALDTAEGAVHLRQWYDRLGYRFVGHVSWPDTNYRSVVLSKPLHVESRLPYLVRPASNEDAEAAVTVIRQSIIESCVADHQNDRAALDQWLGNKTPQQFREWLGDPETFMVVAVIDSAISGVGAVRKCGELSLCYIDPARQRIGLGRAILEALETRAREWDLRELKLVSTCAARDFYERHGYRLTPRDTQDCCLTKKIG